MLEHPLAEFELSRRVSRAAYRRLQRIGWVCTVLIGLIAWGWPDRERSALWALLGGAIGLYLLVKGSHDLFFTDHPRTRLGTRLAKSSDRWFPPLAFLAQHLYVVLMGATLWLGAVRIGLKVEPRDHAVLGGFAILFVLKRFSTAWLQKRPTRPRLFADELLRILVAGLSLAAAIRLAYLFWVPEGIRYGRETPVPVILIWLLVSLAVITQIIITLHRLTSKETFD